MVDASNYRRQMNRKVIRSNQLFDVKDVQSARKFQLLNSGEITEIRTFFSIFLKDFSFRYFFVVSSRHR